MQDFFRSIVDELKDDDVSVMADGRGSAEFTSYVDTGCYMLNALISGSLFGGMADNKVLVVAGESSTGKTFFALGIVKEFLEKYPGSAVMYYDTESAITRDMVSARGIDPDRVIVGEPQTLQDFRTKAITFLDRYGATPKDKRPPLMVVLDSLGMLSSLKEMEDTTAGKDTRDMTKSQLVRGVFRVLRLKLAKLHVPMIVTGHTYASIGTYGTPQELSGGGGVKYASDSILMIRKSKDYDEKAKETVGVFIKGRMYKSRLSRENQDASMRLSYSSGLDRYYGLFDFCLENGVVLGREGKASKYSFPHIPDKKFFRSEIDADPERFWTREILEMMEPAINRVFQYGAGEKPLDEDDDVKFDPETGEILEDQMATLRAMAGE